MKRLIMMLMVVLFTGIAARAQTEVKVSKTTTPTQKVHNTFSKHKHYKGYKVKGKVNGRKVKANVNTQAGEAKIKEN